MYKAKKYMKFLTPEDEKAYYDKEQKYMEDFFKEILAAPVYQRYEDSLLYHLSPTLEWCDFKKKEVHFRYKVKDWQLNPQRGCHGGVSAAMLDTTMGMLAMYFADGCFVSTINLTLNYQKPIPENSEIITRVRSTSWGRTLVSLEGDVYIPETNTVACTSIATYIVLRNRPGQITNIRRED